jgi:hypothetical protein
MESHSANISASHVEAKTETKTITEWFALLSEPYRTQALKNMNPRVADVPKPDQVAAVRDGFDWSATPEGHVYWIHLHKRLRRTTPNTPVAHTRFENSDVHTMD